MGVMSNHENRSANILKLLESSTFKFCAMVLVVAGIAAAYSPDLTWKDWLDQAVYFVGIYAGKEGVRYASDAYKGG
jgi:hypothetical protein